MNPALGEPAIDALRLYLGNCAGLPRGHQFAVLLANWTGHSDGLAYNSLSLERYDLDSSSTYHWYSTSADW